jgi:phosphopantothenoylcysteine synthetase/decarboxylase
MALVAPARTVEVVIELMDPGTCMCERCVAQRQREGSNRSWETASNPDGEEGEEEGEEEDDDESGGDDSDYGDEEDDDEEEEEEDDGDGRSSFETASEGRM